MLQSPLATRYNSCAVLIAWKAQAVKLHNGRSLRRATVIFWGIHKKLQYTEEMLYSDYQLGD